LSAVADTDAAMARWQVGEADVEKMLTAREVQIVRGHAADGLPGLARARQTLTSARSLLEADPTNAFVLTYDATRLACTALLAHQGLRPTTGGGHVAVERAVRAQFGASFALYGRLRRRRNEAEYPTHPDESVRADEGVEALDIAATLTDARLDSRARRESSSTPDGRRPWCRPGPARCTREVMNAPSIADDSYRAVGEREQPGAG
jgi:hypothetical protein